MTFQDAIRCCLKKFLTFQGRSCRSEFWFFCSLHTVSFVYLLRSGLDCDMHALLDSGQPAFARYQPKWVVAVTLLYWYWECGFGVLA
jgi:uncharacterized membrane protein YhaH (DUF805 family)